MSNDRTCSANRFVPWKLRQASAVWAFGIVLT